MNNDFWAFPPSDEDKAELDQSLIDELNIELDVEKTNDDEPQLVRSTGGFKLLSLFTVLVFLTLVFSNWLTIINLPSFGFVDRSRELTQDPAMQKLREAVVEIHTGTSRGTGFNIDESGVIVTNYHVVGNASTAQVNFLRERTFTAVVTEIFPEFDLALLKIDGEGLPSLELDTIYELEAGDGVTIIGNPLWFTRIIIEGKVIGQTVLAGWDVPVYLIEAPVHRGNSGSPVINGEGKAVAVIFATVTTSQDEIMGLAVPLVHLFE